MNNTMSPLKRNFPFSEVREIVDTCDSVEQSSWRWGRVEHFVVERDGAHWMVPARFHIEEGLQEEDTVGHQVQSVTKTITVWERIKP